MKYRILIDIKPLIIENGEASESEKAYKQGDVVSGEFEFVKINSNGQPTQAKMFKTSDGLYVPANVVETHLDEFHSMSIMPSTGQIIFGTIVPIAVGIAAGLWASGQGAKWPLIALAAAGGYGIGKLPGIVFLK